MKFIKILSLIIVLGFYNSMLAQSDTIVKNERNAKFAKYALGYSISAFANFFPAVQLSHDFGINDKLNISLETAYIFGSAYSQNVSGFRLKPGIQYGFSSADEKSYFLIGLQANIRYSEGPRELFEYFPEQNFYKITRTTRSKTLIGGELYLGFRFSLLSRLNLEIGSGLGYGILNVEDADTSDSGFNEFVGIFNPYDLPGRYPFLIVSPHLNLSYDIFK